MYTACIFCNASLGANEMLERFPVGRRIAYDRSTGRLWAICRNCERWNLSPFETRWEAIEDAERLFRATPLKVSGENISLAQTTEGLELVRIGEPPKVELMAWRYGDQFGRRRRRHLIVGGVSLAITAGVVINSIATLAGVGLGAFSIFNTLNLARAVGQIGTGRGDKKRPFVLRDGAGSPLLLTLADVKAAALVPDPSGGWRLEVPQQVWVGKPGKGALVGGRPLTLEGPTATEAISRVMPLINKEGGSRRQIHDAVRTIEDAGSVQRLMRLAYTNQEGRRTHFKVPKHKMPLAVLPARIRLALEMTMHEDDERRAMEGELASLEARWKEADALAKVADSLFLPESVEQELEALRRAR